MKYSTTIIELISGPGTGKSTTAALIYAFLKMNKESTELAREYVKKWAWEGRTISGPDEYYFVGKQIHEESQYFNKIKFVVTDKPLLMDILYARKYASATIAKGIEESVMSYYRSTLESGHGHLRVFLNRTKPYVPEGRYEDEQTARNMDKQLLDLMKEFCMHYSIINTDIKSILSFVGDLVTLKDESLIQLLAGPN